MLQVQEWADQYPEVRAELNEIERSMESYAMAHAIEPSTTSKKEIFRKINAEENAKLTIPPAATVRSIAPFWKYAAAASVILLIGSAVLNITYYNKYQKANTAYIQTKNALVAVNENVRMMDSDLNVVKNKYSLPVSLDGLPAAPEAAAKIFWMKNTGEVYIDPSNLPNTPEGMQYQLWAIVDGKPVDGGMIITSKTEKKYHIQKMKSFGNVKVQAFAVTLESEGGNPTPKGQMYVMGKM
jgi:anti-sigma-K factor RskA